MVEKKYIKYLIKKYENISLFFHEYPDGDALGSVYGFLSFLKKEYPQKKVSIVGATKIDMHYYEKFLPVDTLEEPDDKFIQNSLGIVCDCANSSRVFTQKHLLCKKLINIDHHQNNELFGTTNWVDNKSSSCCEMVSRLLLKISKETFDDKIASYLYWGIITDTNRFFYNSTTAKTLKIVSKLYKYINEPFKINLLLSERSINEIKFNTKVQSLIKFNIKKHIASLILPESIFEQYDVFPNSMIWTMGNIKDIEIWSSIYFDKTNNIWKGSIRSKTIDISTVATKFNGGGHKNASGFKLNNKEDFALVLKELSNLVS